MKKITFSEAIQKMARHSSNMKFRNKGLKNLCEMTGLNFKEALAFWGLLEIGSETESRGRTALTSSLADIIANDQLPRNPIEIEIYRRIVTSNVDASLNQEVKKYLKDFLEADIPLWLVHIVEKKFDQIPF